MTQGRAGDREWGRPLWWGLGATGWGWCRNVFLQGEACRGARRVRRQETRQGTRIKGYQFITKESSLNYTTYFNMDNIYVCHELYYVYYYEWKVARSVSYTAINTAMSHVRRISNNSLKGGHNNETNSTIHYICNKLCIIFASVTNLNRFMKTLVLLRGACDILHCNTFILATEEKTSFRPIKKK